MTGCRNCEQLPSGDCGAHGPALSPTPCPGRGQPPSAHARPPSPRADLLPCGHTAPPGGGATCQWWGCGGALEIRAGPPLPTGTGAIEVARLTAELAAERGERAATEAREGRLREAIGRVVVQSSARPDLSALIAALAEPADDSVLREHVAVVVRGAVGRVEVGGTVSVRAEPCRKHPTVAHGACVECLRLTREALRLCAEALALLGTGARVPVRAIKDALAAAQAVGVEPGGAKKETT